MNEPILQICGIEPESIVDGPGFRYVIFTQGCPHHCVGCHNPESHPFTGGRPLGLDEVLSAFDENPLLSGVTFSGGEPFCQAAALLPIAEAIHARKKTVVTFTGYTYDTLRAMRDPAVDALLKETDILVDGPYIEAERDLSLRFRGSRNQRVLRLEKGEIVGEEA